MPIWKHTGKKQRVKNKESRCNDAAFGNYAGFNTDHGYRAGYGQGNARLRQNYQWDEVYPTEQDFAADITQGDLFVSEAEGQICGLICINQTEPAVYADAGWTLAEKALVLHRMAVDPDLRGRGTGSELLQQAETLALSLGLRYLKTDTYALNEKAQQLFLKHGYHFCGEIQFRKMEHQFYCYEKVL